MAIRSSARGLVIRDDMVLLEKCGTETGRLTYVLPGGGQNLYEPLREAVEREVLEECGYVVRAGRLVAVCELIYRDEAVRREVPDYTHRVHHIFLCRLADDVRCEPTEKDWNQDESVWMPLEEADALDNLFPSLIRGKISKLTQIDACEYLGCEYA
jgi:8-oxo-dGTP diphosphatase